MADYHSPTVVMPPIPETDMTPIEQLLLPLVFDETVEDGGSYFHSWCGPSEVLNVDSELLRAALAQPAENPSPVEAIAVSLLARHDDAFGDKPDDIEIDLTGPGCGWPEMLQAIVRRSRTIDEIVATTAMTCTKMRPDGFGGSVMRITADRIQFASTTDMLERMWSDHPAPPNAPSGGDDATADHIEASRHGTYRVSWDIDIDDATSPLDAVRQAQETALDRFYNVEAPDGAITVVELDPPPVARHARSVSKVLDAAERFIAGFAEDGAQEGVDQLLADIRNALKGRTDHQIVDDTPSNLDRESWATLRFVPQASVGGYLVSADPEGPCEWTVSRALLRNAFPRQQDFVERHEARDDLRFEGAAPVWVREWSGPFEVELVDDPDSVWAVIFGAADEIDP